MVNGRQLPALSIMQGCAIGERMEGENLGRGGTVEQFSLSKVSR